jgi:phage terminase small subunit
MCTMGERALRTVAADVEPPDGLSAEMQGFWRQVVATWRLDARHLQILEEACRARDRCTEARRVVDEKGILISGGRYGDRQNPAVQVERDSRLSFLRCMRALHLEEAEERFLRGVR